MLHRMSCCTGSTSCVLRDSNGGWYVDWQVSSFQNGTRLATNLETTVHVGPQDIDTFHKHVSETILDGKSGEDVRPSHGLFLVK